jgi:hypothetical protein
VSYWFIVSSDTVSSCQGQGMRDMSAFNSLKHDLLLYFSFMLNRFILFLLLFDINQRNHSR